MRCLTNIGDRPARRVASNQERLAALRKAVEGLQAFPVPLPVPGAEADAAAPLQGLRGLNWGLPADLPCGALNEVVAAHPDRPAAFGFLLALTALVLESRAGSAVAVLVAARRAMSDFGAPYGHGFAQLGVDVGRLILVETRTDKEALWALEETLRSEVRPAMMVGALAGGLDLTSSRRLNLAAAPRRTPLVLLSGAKAAGTSAAAARWRIAAAPAARDRFGALAAPRWHVALERSRTRPPGSWLIEWDHVAHRFRVVAGLADRPPVAGLRQAG
jgi:protein ImuA